MNHQIELSFYAHAENEAFARMVISAFMVRMNPTLSVISEIRTAVSEAVTNAIVHAYHSSAEGRIILRAAINENRITLQVEDFGCGIPDISLAMQPFFTTQPEQERTGMGFSLMQSFMDSVRVESKPGIGTCVSMMKLIQERDEDVL